MTDVEDNEDGGMWFAVRYMLYFVAVVGVVVGVCVWAIYTPKQGPAVTPGMSEELRAELDEMHKKYYDPQRIDEANIRATPID